MQIQKYDLPPAPATVPKAAPVQASIPPVLTSPKAGQTPTVQTLGSPAGTSTVVKAATLPNQVPAQPAAVPRLVSPVVRGECT